MSGREREPGTEPAAGPGRESGTEPEAERLLALVHGVLERLDLETVLHRVLAAGRQITGARYAALGILDESRTRIERFVTAGIDDAQRARIGDPPSGRGVLGDLIHDPTPLRLADIARHPDATGLPAGHPPMRSFLGVPILIDGAAWGNLYLTEKPDGEFDDEDERSAVLLAAFAALAVDHAARYRESEGARREAQRTVAALDATLRVARALGAETDLTAVLELVVERGLALVDAHVMMIELIVDEELELAAGAGDLPAGVLGQRFPLAGTVAEVALRDGVSQRLTDADNRARFLRHGVGRFGVQADHGLVVPMIFRGWRLGVLIAFGRGEAGVLTPRGEGLLEALAASAATAVATARTVADEGRRRTLAAADAERSRWARELHDETLQALGNLRLTLATARRDGGEPALRAGVDGAIAQLEDDIAALRSLITELRPAALDQLGLQPALLALVERNRAVGLEIDADIAVADGDRLAPELETGVYRIVQEALTNAVRHGRASQAQVSVRVLDGAVTLSVVDDGQGFDESAPRSGFGITGMRERAQLLGGRLTVHSATGSGSQVSARLPLGADGRRRPSR